MMNTPIKTPHRLIIELDGDPFWFTISSGTVPMERAQELLPRYNVSIVREEQRLPTRVFLIGRGDTWAGKGVTFPVVVEVRPLRQKHDDDAGAEA